MRNKSPNKALIFSIKNILTKNTKNITLNTLIEIMNTIRLTDVVQFRFCRIVDESG